VEHGIPSLLPDDVARALASETAREAKELSSIDLVAREARTRDEESAYYDDLYPDEEFRNELDSYVRMLDPRPSDTVLDVGAGTGRVTKEFVSRCGRLVCADLSMESLRRLASRPGVRERRPLVVHADATALPFAGESFDRVAAFGILCMLPGEDLRRRFVDEVHRVLRPGGVLVCATFHYAWVKRLWALAGHTEGALHEGFQNRGRVYYRNDTRRELVALLERRFRVVEVRGVCHRVPLLSNSSRRLARVVDGLLGRLPFVWRALAVEQTALCRKTGTS
jgi:SAM-dependent methyltransferase